MKKSVKIPYYAVDDPFGIVYRNNSTPNPVGPHTHNALEIYFTLSDLPDVLLNNTVFSVPANSLIVIPPNCIHQLYTNKLTVYERYIISINSAWISNVLGKNIGLFLYSTQGSSPMIVNLSQKQAEELKIVLGSSIRPSSAVTLSDYTRFFSLLPILDAYISKGINKKPSVSISQSQETVNAVISYINDHISGAISIEAIAQEFHLNKDYLGRLFKEHTHSTIGHYIALHKSGLAKDLLSKGLTVNEVQETLGFSSYAYFFKFFKKMTGISPSQYKKTFK